MIPVCQSQVELGPNDNKDAVCGPQIVIKNFESTEKEDIIPLMKCEEIFTKKNSWNEKIGVYKEIIGSTEAPKSQLKTSRLHTFHVSVIAEPKQYWWSISNQNKIHIQCRINSSGIYCRVIANA